MAGLKCYFWFFIFLLCLSFVLGTDCVDLDGDSYFSNLFECGISDCNDEFNFYYSETGEYCPLNEYFVLDPDEGYYAQDFALIKDNSNNLHAIYIRFPPGTAWQIDPINSMDFGHDSTSNLSTWNSHLPALNISSLGSWDDEHLWAPSIVYNGLDQLYYMYYTGVTDGFTQGPSNHKERIGLATSNDLINWDRYSENGCDGTIGDGCLWDCNLTWTVWGKETWEWSTLSWQHQCRDPFIFDDSVNGNWYMVYSTVMFNQNNGNNISMVLGLAKSSDLIHWVDLGPINSTFGSKAESAHIVENNGIYYLFYTTRDNGPDGIFYRYTSDLESNIWSPKIRVPNSNHNPIASEFLEFRNQSLFAYIYPLGEIRFKSIIIEDNNISLGLLSPLDCAYINPSFVFPGAEEILNGLDDNCNGVIDEENSVCVDFDFDNYGAEFNLACPNLEIDCDDNNPFISPNVHERCGNYIDDNCNGVIDEMCINFDYYLRMILPFKY